MKPKKRNMLRKNRFTLIELLIVIAIIAILEAMLLPALNREMARAQAIDCVSRKKQLGMAQAFYANDYKVMVQIVPQATGYAPWMFLLSEGPEPYALNYVSGSMMICTANSYIGNGKWTDSDFNRWYAPCGMPRWADVFITRRYTANGSGDCFTSGIHPPCGVFNPKNCKDASRVILFADAFKEGNATPKKGGSWIFFDFGSSRKEMIHLAHDGRSAVCFADGSAGLRTGKKLYADTFNKPIAVWAANRIIRINLEE